MANKSIKLINMLIFFFSLRKNGLLRTQKREWRRRKQLENAVKRRQQSQAVFVGITGSSGKSTTTALLAHLLKTKGNVRSQVLENLYSGLLQTMESLTRDDNYVVVETAVAKPGDMQPQASLLKPDIAIVTIIGIEHYSAFKTKEAVAEEKRKLVSALPASGLAVLNADDPMVLGMREHTQAKCITYGWSDSSDYKIRQIKADSQEALTVTFENKGTTYEISSKLNGEHFFLSMLAATATALELGLSIEKIQASTQTFEGIFGRCSSYEIKNGPTFILDTAKAPYETLGLAFNTLKKYESKRKWIIVGQISDYPGNPKPKYRNAYRLAKEIADKVIFIGPHSHRSGAETKEIENGNFLTFNSFFDFTQKFKENFTENDVILIKSSQGLHLERIALSQNKNIKCIEDTCGFDFSCHRCGLYEHPFLEHKKNRKNKYHTKKFNQSAS